MQEHFYTVSSFIETLNFELESLYSEVVIQGEVSEYKVSQGKWVWFTLKDKEASLSCFMILQQMRFPLEDGMEIRVLGSPTVFAKSGKFTFRPKYIEPVGVGALQKALDLTKKKLEAEGLFDASRKRSIPHFPQRIGLITSPDAAACTDFLKVIEARWKGLEIDIHPVSVQGLQSINDIVQAFENINRYHQYDVLVLTRGGGSLEDLQSFNSEEVVRAVAASRIPVVVAVGHERDWSLADLAADLRASTPSNAAELIVPERDEFIWRLENMNEKISFSFLNKIERMQRMVLDTKRSLIDSFDEKREYLHQRWNVLERCLENFSHLASQKKQNILQFNKVLFYHIEHMCETRKQSLLYYQKTLQNLHPDRILDRGYTRTLDKNGKTIRSIKQVKKGDSITTLIKGGKIISEIKNLNI